MVKFRKTAITNSIINYTGFIIGMIYVYLFTSKNYFTTEQYGLIKIFFDLAELIFVISGLGYFNNYPKLSPIYKKYSPNKNSLEIFKISFLIFCVGSIMIYAVMYIFKVQILNFFSTKSSLLSEHFNLIIPFSFGFGTFFIIENFLYTQQKSSLIVFYKEIVFRILLTTTILICIIKSYRIDIFYSFFAFSYIFLVLVIITFHLKKYKIFLTPIFSDLTKKLNPVVIKSSVYMYVIVLIITLSKTLDSILITSISKNGLEDTGIFFLSTFIVSIMQVPQRNLAYTVGLKIVEEMRNKNYNEAQRLYQRTSINLLIFGIIIYATTILFFNNIFEIVDINPLYKKAELAIILLGFSKLFDMFTSLNSNVTSGSKKWMFDLNIHTLITLGSIPLNYYLIKYHGLNGAAITSLLVCVCINTFRCIYVFKKFNVNILNKKVYPTILISVILFFITNYLFKELKGWVALVKPVSFFIIFVFCVYYFKLTPDLKIVLNNIRVRVKKFVIS